MLLIGDVNHLIGGYLRLIEEHEHSIQLGDIALTPFTGRMIPDGHYTIWGNKFDTSLLPCFLPAGSIVEGVGVACAANVIVSHSCPIEAGEIMDPFNYIARPYENELQEIYETHKPALWVFSHWRISRDFCLNGTQFICLNEMETLAI